MRNFKNRRDEIMGKFVAVAFILFVAAIVYAMVGSELSGNPCENFWGYRDLRCVGYFNNR